MTPQRTIRPVALCFLPLVALLGAPLPSVAAQPDPAVRQAIREQVESLLFEADARAAGEPVLARQVIGELYGESEHRPLWKERARIDALWDIAELAAEQGLDRTDYPLDTLSRLLPPEGLPATAEGRATVDILATEAFVRMGYQLSVGKVNPASLFVEWNFTQNWQEGRDRTISIMEIIDAANPAERMERIIDRGSYFERLVVLLADYRALESAGGWPAVPEGPTLRKGDSGPRVAALRARLAVTDGAETAPPSGAQMFDEALEDALIRFQERHGLDADGIAGRASFAALNVPVARRILQIRASLERGRWVFDTAREVADQLVLVNVASAQAAYVVDGEMVWTTRVQVGKPYRQTPVFRGDIQYLVFNPTWTVPPTILRKDVIPRLQKGGRAYLDRKQMDLLDRSGQVIDTSKLDWSSLRPDNFPYIVRQRPGPWNALGMVKFIFPNPHYVFLHDTPSRALFDRADRTFSSGCIRVEEPFELAERLLDNPDKWGPEGIQAVLDTEEQQVVHLEKPVPVAILYWTADVDQEGRVVFAKDIYGRDAKLFEAMAAPPSIDMRAESD